MITLIVFNLIISSTSIATNHNLISNSNNSVNRSTYSPSVPNQINPYSDQTINKSLPNVTNAVYEGALPNSGVVHSTYGNSLVSPDISTLIPKNVQDLPIKTNSQNVAEPPSVVNTTYANLPSKKYIVKFATNIDKQQFTSTYAKRANAIQADNNGVTIKREFRNLPQLVLELTNQEYDNLKKRKDVIYAEPDYTVSVTESTYTNTPSDIVTWGYDALKADTLHKREIFGSGVKIAIIDTGIDLNHPDLHIEGGTSFVGESYQDDQGHGTRVAGVIAAQINNIGVKGIAPLAKIYSVKALDNKGQASYSQIISAIDWCIDNDINIINMSFGGTENSEALQEAVKKAWDLGILVVAAAGNSGSPTLLYPAQYTSTIAVSSINLNLTASDFSNYNDRLELVAPGSLIYTTDRNSTYVTANGTSLAAAYVTGSAAEVWSVHPEWTAEQVRVSLLRSATYLGDKQHFGFGLVNPVSSVDQNYVRTVTLDTYGTVIGSTYNNGTVNIAYYGKTPGNFSTISAGDHITTSINIEEQIKDVYIGVFGPSCEKIEDPSCEKIEDIHRIHGENGVNLSQFSQIQYSWYTTTSTPLGEYTIKYAFCYDNPGYGCHKSEYWYVDVVAPVEPPIGPPDTIPPNVLITNISSNVFKQFVPVVVDYILTDNVAVTVATLKVERLFNGNWDVVDTISLNVHQTSYNWIPRLTGYHRFTITASDHAGNQKVFTTPSNYFIDLDNDPTISMIVSASNNEFVNNKAMTISLSAEDDVAVRSVELYVQYGGSDSSHFYEGEPRQKIGEYYGSTAQFNFTPQVYGNYKFIAKAFDSADKFGQDYEVLWVDREISANLSKHYSVESEGEYFVNTYTPSEQLSFDLSTTGFVQSARLYLDGLYIENVTGLSVITVQAPWDVASHEYKVIVSDSSGTEASTKLTLYALVQVKGEVVSYLPSDAVANSPFHEDQLNSELAFRYSSAYRITEQYRQIQEIVLMGKSNGSYFIEKPWIKSAQKIVHNSAYCDDELSQVDSTLNWIGYNEIQNDSGSFYVQSHLETKVSAITPDIWGNRLKEVDNDGAIPQMIGNTLYSTYVPSIYSTMKVAISPDGITKAEWVDNKSEGKIGKSSFFPYHFAYKNGELVSNQEYPSYYNHEYFGQLVRKETNHPPINMEWWMATAKAYPIKFLGLLNILSNKPTNGFMSDYWFGGLLCECARQRLSHYNPVDYYYLQNNFPQLDFTITQKATNEAYYFLYKPNIVPFLTNEGKSRGKPAPKGPTDPANCVYMGCPGKESIKSLAFKSPVNVHIYDSLGNHAGPLADGSMENNIGDIIYIIEEEHKYIMMPNNLNYRIELDGYADGLVTVESTDYFGKNKLNFEQYYKIPVTTNTRAQISVKSKGLTVNYDLNGSGQFEHILPTVSNTNSAPVGTDNVPPVSSILVNGNPLSTGKYYEPIEIKFIATDAFSGTQYTEYSFDGGTTWLPYSRVVRLEEFREYQLSYRSTDINNNVESTKTQIIIIEQDITPPTTSINIVGTEGQPDYYRSIVEVYLSGTDTQSGLRKTEYSLDGGIIWLNYTTPIILNNEGTYIVKYRSLDKVNNLESVHTKQIVIDKKAPSTPTLLTSTIDWTTQNITFSIGDSTDNLSGVFKYQYKLSENGEWVDYSHMVTYGNEGITPIYARTIDYSGNISSEAKQIVKIDKTNPTAPEIIASTYEWSSIKVTFVISSGTDTFSGVQKYQYMIGNSGVWSDYSTMVPINVEGQTTIYARTIDNVGLASSQANAIIKIDKTVPSTPTNLMATGKTNTSISLQWNASSDSVSYVKGYDIYRAGVWIAYTANPNFVVTGLTSKTNYTFAVKARDAASNLSPSSMDLIVKTN